MEDARQRAVEEYKRENGGRIPEVIIMPKYKQDKRLKVDREDMDHKPTAVLFVGLGWDEDATTKRKHYR